MGLVYLEQVELLREKMIKTGLEYGLQNAETIEISRQLDQLLNEYANLEKAQYNSSDLRKNIF